MLHKTAQERYEKLKAVFSRLMHHFNRDDLDDFILTANSLREWVRHDQTLLDEQKAALERLVVDESLDWQICNQIANSQKHVHKTPRYKRRGPAPKPIPLVTAVEVRPGSGGFAVPPTMQIVGAGEEIMVECAGRRESALAFTIRLFQHFRYIFEVAPIPQSERVLRNLNEVLLNP
jgi:hypothetical protein